MLPIPPPARVTVFASSLSRWLELRIPYGLLLWVILSGVSCWQLAVVMIMRERTHPYVKLLPGDDPRDSRDRTLAAVTILVFFVLIKCHWIGAWVHAFYLTRRADKSPHSRTPRAQRVMQSSLADVRGISAGETNNFRYRTCARCSSTSALGDRCYHCSTLQVHLPVYDHYCYWLWVCVYLDTMKPYLMCLFYLSVDVAYIFVLSLWAAVSREMQGFWIHTSVCTLTVLFILWLAAAPIVSPWKRLAIKNEVYAESVASGGFWLSVTKPDSRTGGKEVQFVCFGKNPWDKGWRDNLYEVLGETIWAWPFFWVQPARVKNYGKRPESDLPLGDVFRRFERGDLPAEEVSSVVNVENPRVWINRRAVGRSSGFERV